MEDVVRLESSIPLAQLSRSHHPSLVSYGVCTFEFLFSIATIMIVDTCMRSCARYA